MQTALEIWSVVFSSLSSAARLFVSYLPSLGLSFPP